MADADPLTPQRVADLVLANRVIRAPDYRTEHDEGVEFTDPERGLQWGADVIPALLDLFRVAEHTDASTADTWVGMARHWRGGVLRIEWYRYFDGDDPDPVLVVTEMTGRTAEGGIEDSFLGPVELPDAVPSEAEWVELDKRYHAARRADSSDGTASVSAFVDALPDWKRGVARQFDEIIEREVPAVHRAVRYHQPFYGLADRGWFASLGAFSKHVKLTFVCADPLDPQPPSGSGPTRQALDVTRTETLDEDQVASWLRQAAANPGMNWG